MAALRRVRLPHVFAAGTALFAIGGCYSYPQYGYPQSSPGYYSSPPPGIYQQPGMYPPMQAAPPGQFTPTPAFPDSGSFGPGTTTPPGGFSNDPFPANPTPANPGSSLTPNPFPGNARPTNPTYTQPFTPSPIEGGASDPYRPQPRPRSSEPFTPDGTRRAPVENLPPQPRDPEPFSSGTTNFGTSPGDNRFTTPSRGVPRTTTPRGTTPRTTQPPQTFPDESPFGSDSRVQPVKPVGPNMAASRPLSPMQDGPQLTPIETAENVVPVGESRDAEAPTGGLVATAGAVAHPNPYDFDRDGYAWLRGTVDYDDEEGNWFLIYSLTPDEHDPYQGGLPLTGPAEELEKLQDGDVVLVEGAVDAGQVDRRNMPYYRCVTVSRLTPAAQ